MAAALRRPGRTALLGQSPTEDDRMGIGVSVEGRKSHEEGKNEGTREGERHVVAKNATAPGPALQSLFQRSLNGVDATRPT